jgi:Fe-Mn family superoxide dismutase
VALEKLDAAVSSGDVSDVSTIIGLQGALKFNGGGNINHCLFWDNLSPDGGELKDGPLKSKIAESFGDFDVSIRVSVWTLSGARDERGQEAKSM